MSAGAKRLRLVSDHKQAEAFIRLVRKTTSLADLKSLMEALSHEMGFLYFALIHHVDLRGGPPGYVDLKRYPDAIVERIIHGCNWRRDPVIRACYFAGGAFLWSELARFTKLDRRDRAALAFGARAGVEVGITVPCPLLGDFLGSCTFAGHRNAAAAARHLGLAQMIGPFAFGAARRLVAGSPLPETRPLLHPKPRDCIVLAGRGHSNKEIARALGITPRTVDGYLTEARTLFGARSRAELLVELVLAGQIDLAEVKRRQPE